MVNFLKKAKNKKTGSNKHWQGSMVILRLTYSEIAKLFPTAAAPFYIPKAMYKVLISLLPYQHLFPVFFF